MRTVVWTDDRGFKHRGLVRDGDPDSMAPMGISQDPPNLQRLDWEAVMRDIHNALVDQKVVNWLDYQRHDIRGVILGALQRRIQTLFREVENG